MLHKAAQKLVVSGFPKSYKELIEYPGFGPYTSRAVSSIAFGESVGIVDGNAIRVLSRRYGIKEQWWTTKGRSEFQKFADQLAKGDQAHLVNQALMDLGSSVCAVQTPKCMLCPWFKTCVARKEDLITALPLQKPRKATEFWEWRPVVHQKGQKIAFVENNYAPFLKGQLLLPGTAKKISSKPKKYHFKHAITHHNIFVSVEFSKKIKQDCIQTKIKWIEKNKISKVVPTSLVKKALETTS
jgi:A/G-specific adenine glycosylase